LLADIGQQRALGALGRQLVATHFSLEAAAKRQLAIYELAESEHIDISEQAASILNSCRKFVAYYARRKIRRLAGIAASDDFNLRPLAGRALAMPGEAKP
jgi:hypothetical protein